MRNHLHNLSMDLNCAQISDTSCFLSTSLLAGGSLFDSRATMNYTSECQMKTSNPSKTADITNAAIKNTLHDDLTAKLSSDIETASAYHCKNTHSSRNSIESMQHISKIHDIAPDDPTVFKQSTSCGCSSVCDSNCNKTSHHLHFMVCDRPYTCDVCLQNYPTENSLRNHLRCHSGDRPHKCETCDKAFATNSHLTTHRRTHSGEKPFRCPYCVKSFSDRSSYVKHTRTHGGTTSRKHKCPTCDNLFVDSCGLKKHIRIHTGERPYVCATCDKTFATSSTFVAHKRIHSGERPYGCTCCDKRFVTKSHLLTHSRVHSGEKPFQCLVCDRAFADSSSYRRHQRLHTKELAGDVKVENVTG